MTKYCSEIQDVSFMKIVYSCQITGLNHIRILNNKDRKLYQHLHNIVKAGLDSKEFKIKMPIDDIIEWIMRSCRGLIYDWCLYNAEFSLVEEGKKYFSYIVKCLRAEEI